MLGYALSALVAVGVVFQFFILPAIQYLQDPKGLRRFPALDCFAGFTNLSFMFEANRGFRSKKLASLHKIYPVIRTGPNALSYGNAQAIKVCGTPASTYLFSFSDKSRIYMAITHVASRTANM